MALELNSDPRLWGPKFWFTLHTISVFYPEKPNQHEMASAINLFDSLTYLLPCETCKTHYKAMLDLDPVRNHVGSRNELVRYVLNLHNSVAARIKKPTYTYAQFIDEFTGHFTSSTGMWWVLVVVALVAAGVGWWFFRRRSRPQYI